MLLPLPGCGTSSSRGQGYTVYILQLSSWMDGVRRSARPAAGPLDLLSRWAVQPPVHEIIHIRAYRCLLSRDAAIPPHSAEKSRFSLLAPRVKLGPPHQRAQWRTYAPASTPPARPMTAQIHLEIHNSHAPHRHTLRHSRVRGVRTRGHAWSVDGHCVCAHRPPRPPEGASNHS